MPIFGRFNKTKSPTDFVNDLYSTIIPELQSEYDEKFRRLSLELGRVIGLSDTSAKVHQLDGFNGEVQRRVLIDRHSLPGRLKLHRVIVNRMYHGISDGSEHTIVDDLILDMYRKSMSHRRTTLGLSDEEDSLAGPEISIDSMGTTVSYSPGGDYSIDSPVRLDLPNIPIRGTLPRVLTWLGATPTGDYLMPNVMRIVDDMSTAVHFTDVLTNLGVSTQLSGIKLSHD